MLTDRQVIDSLSAGVLVAGRDEVARHANPAACRMLQAGVEACIDQPVPLLLGMTASLRDHGLDAPGAECRLELDLPAGPAGATLHNVGGHGFVCLFRPTEEGRRADPYLSRHERESAIGAIVAAFAHEVRNPIAAIAAAAEMLRTDLPPHHGEAHFAIIERQVRRLAALAHTPIALGRPPSTQRVLCAIDQLVADAVAIVSAAAQRGRVGFAVRIEPGLARVSVGERELVDALAALLENAIHASPAGATVSVIARPAIDAPTAPRPVVEVAAAPRRVAIEIVDRGAGMAPGEIAQALRAFTTTKAGAAGSGLALAHRYIVDSGGRLAIEPGPDRGLIARIELTAEAAR